MNSQDPYQRHQSIWGRPGVFQEVDFTFLHIFKSIFTWRVYHIQNSTWEWMPYHEDKSLFMVQNDCIGSKQTSAQIWSLRDVQCIQYIGALVSVVHNHLHINIFLNSALGSSKQKCIHFSPCRCFDLRHFTFFFRDHFATGHKTAFDMLTFCLIQFNLFKLCAHIYTLVIFSVRFMKPVM